MGTFLAKRQLDALKNIGKNLLNLPGILGTFNLTKIISALVILSQLFGSILFDTPTTPSGRKLDLSKFDLAWSDEFESGVFDKTRWSGSWCWGDDGVSPCGPGWWHRSQVSYRDGNMIIGISYRQDGPAGPAYYTYGMDTKPGSDGPSKIGFEQCYGYFELRCILPKGEGLNPAFWLICDGMFNTDPDGGLTDGGVTGCEIDVFETSTKYADNSLNPRKNAVYHTIHVDSYDEYHRSEMQGSFLANNPRSEYNTYGIEWNPDGYIWYVNGVETARTDFGGVCQVPLYLIISLGVDENIKDNPGLPAEFIVDYVRAYQYNDLL